MPKKIQWCAVFVLAGCFLFSSKLNAQNKPDDEVIKVDTNLVTVPVIVSDRRNRYISGLNAENFTVFKDGQKQTIEYFAAEESPITIKTERPRDDCQFRLSGKCFVRADKRPRTAEKSDNKC
jgi:hypothetical protein